jgi:hypothetical protein
MLYRSRETSPVDAAARAEESKSNLLGGMMTASSLSLQYLEAGFRICIHFIRIRILLFRLNIDPDPDPVRIQIQSGSRVFMTKN